MKIKVRVDGREFDVQVGDLEARPIVAVVEGERFEVWPEEECAEPAAVGTQGAVGATGHAPSPTAAAPQRASRPRPQAVAVPKDQATHTVYAPLPGSVDSIAVQPGDRVTAGGPLCVIEAMKMKNTIRAPREGEIAAVRISAGQHVKHGDVLVEYAKPQM